jgi:short-subunit dehydrogenase
MALMQLKDKLVVISGASRGIGAVTAKALAAEGCVLALLARTQKDLDQVAEAVRKAGGKAYPFVIDLRKLDEIEAVSAQILRDLGTPDVLIHNAGVGRWLFTEETPADEAEDMIALPYKAAFHLTRCLLPSMLAARSGAILAVNSPASIMVWPGSAGYAASRWALRGFVEALRVDLHGTGVRVSEVLLGKVDSDYFVANAGTEARLPRIAKLIPVLSTERAAAILVKVLKTGRRRKIAPMMLRIMSWFAWLTPRIVRALVRSTGHRRK